MKSFGKLSIKGSNHFEEKMTELLNDISEDIENSVSQELYKCVILIGGYGRGEGGVITKNGIEYPHNNFDFLIISKNLSKKNEKNLEKDINKIITSYCNKIDLDFDLSILSEFKLNSCDFLYQQPILYLQKPMLVYKKVFFPIPLFLLLQEVEKSASNLDLKSPEKQPHNPF